MPPNQVNSAVDAHDVNGIILQSKFSKSIYGSYQHTEIDFCIKRQSGGLHGAGSDVPRAEERARHAEAGLILQILDLVAAAA